MKEKNGGNIAKYHEGFRNNKLAFEDVIGDPFALEPFTGNYIKLQQRSSIQASNNEFDMGRATKNPAQPNVNDFFCDVELIVTQTLDTDTVRRFNETYIEESAVSLTPQERITIEQILGKLFRERKISPVIRYFRTVRHESVRAKERNQYVNTKGPSKDRLSY